MSTTYEKIKVLSNKQRFRIVELTQNKEMSITEISDSLKLSYTKCADYIKLLERHYLIEKRKDGKNVLIKSKLKLHKDKIIF